MLQALLSTAPSNSDSLHHRTKHRAAAQCNIPHQSQTPGATTMAFLLLRAWTLWTQKPSCSQQLFPSHSFAPPHLGKEGTHFLSPSASDPEHLVSYPASCHLQGHSTDLLLCTSLRPTGPNQLTDRAATILQLSSAVQLLCWSWLTHSKGTERLRRTECRFLVTTYKLCFAELKLRETIQSLGSLWPLSGGRKAHSKLGEPIQCLVLRKAGFALPSQLSALPLSPHK